MLVDQFTGFRPWSVGYIVSRPVVKQNNMSGSVWKEAEGKLFSSWLTRGKKDPSPSRSYTTPPMT